MADAGPSGQLLPRPAKVLSPLPCPTGPGAYGIQPLTPHPGLRGRALHVTHGSRRGLFSCALWAWPREPQRKMVANAG